MTRWAHADTVATGLLVLCALVATSITVRREIRDTRRSPVSAWSTVADWKTFTSRAQRTGPESPTVILTVFSDFQCPYCAQLATSVDSILARYPSDVSMDFRHFPITAIHPHAKSAALAAECARDQGRFKQYHDALFSSQQRIGSVEWTRFAVEAGVPDTAALARCLEDARALQRLHADSVAAAQLQVRGTPTILVNSRRYSGSPPLAALDSLVRSQLAATGR